MRRALIGLGVATLIGTGCSQIPLIGGNQGSPTAVSPTPNLDPAVATPAGFPSGVPIYPKARLTATSSFTSSALNTWGLVWETADNSAKVTAFYSTQLASGDWTLTPVNETNGAAFAATFASKTNARVKGTIAIRSDAGVTTIALSLVAPP